MEQDCLLVVEGESRKMQLKLSLMYAMVHCPDRTAELCASAQTV